MIDNDLSWYLDNGYPQGVIDTVKEITRSVEKLYMFHQLIWLSS